MATKKSAVPAKKAPAKKNAKPATKATAKKTTEKSETPAKVKDLASGVYIKTTKTISLEIKGKAYSRKASQEEFDTIAPKLDLYNRTPDASKAKEKLEKTLIEFMEAKTIVEKKAKATKEVVKKAVQKKVKKEAEAPVVLPAEEKDLIKSLEGQELSEDDINRLQALINKNKKVEQRTTPVATYTPRRGEH